MNRLRLERQIREVDAGSDTWRTIARAAPPWEVVRDGASAVLWNTREMTRIGTLEGVWASSVARYLNAMEPRSGLALAELLWLVGGHGNMADVQSQAHRLLTAMNVDAVT
ncbi:hypothetical protein [Actinophytocola sp.]|uniref:hypothetical protein n=1 Tax=Actinophytocola sp. TaxID=1872138 RepID=UPI003D6C40CE